MTFFLAPNGRWSARTLVGDAAVDGYVKTWVAGTIDVPKVTWSDPEGQNENPTTIPLDAAGEANIYWGYDPEDPELYFIEVYDKDDNLVYTQDNYPTTFSTGGDPALKPSFFNYVRNPQFTYWTNSTNYPTISASQTIYDYVANEWTFERSNTTAICNVSQQLFNLGQSVVPGNPLSYLHYECGNATGASETYKRFKQVFQSVQTLSGQVISFAFWAKSAAGSTVSINIAQFFGTGGTPSATVITPVLTAVLNASWRRYTTIITLPVATGTLGTDANSDYTALTIDLPLNAFASALDACNVQLQASDAITDFIVNSQEANYLAMQNLISQSLFKTGSFRNTLSNDSDPGWVLCDDGTLGNVASNATHAYLSTQGLFSVIWNKIANQYAPIFNSDGTIGTRGANATADYNANKQLSLTKTLGRVLATAGQAVLTSTFTTYASQTCTRSGNNLVLGSVTGFYTGTPVQFTTTGTLPAPLVVGTTYYAMQVDNVSLIQVATSQANAIAGTFITLTDAGTGVHTIYQAGAIIMADTSSFYTGTPVTLTTTGTLPAPLAISTTYYVIRLDSITIELATTLENAVLGIPIVVTDAGTGTQTITINYENWQPGQFIGEFAHTPVEVEMFSHDHPGSTISGSADDGSGGGPWCELQGDANDLFAPESQRIAPQGGGQPFNITQPTTFIYTQLKL